MQVQAVNRHAVRKYEEFQSAIEMVRLALDEAGKVVTKIRTSPADRPMGWRIPSREEVEKNFNRARSELDVLVNNAKKYEKELLARGWMV